MASLLSIERGVRGVGGELLLNSVGASWGCYNQQPQPGDFKRWKFNLSQFWGPGVQDQAVGRAIVSLRNLRNDPSGYSQLPVVAGRPRLKDVLV